jgi:hypothetical protein
MDSNPRSPVSGAVIFWAFYVPVVIGQRPDSCGSRKNPYRAHQSSLSITVGPREAPFLQRCVTNEPWGCGGTHPGARRVCAAASRPGAEIGAIRLVRVWHRMFNGGTKRGGTG